MTYAIAAIPATYFLPDVLTFIGRNLPKVSHKKVGGIRFFKVGRINFSVSISKKG